MASKKSKILAIAFCAAVMAGIHVNPVLAGWGYTDTDTHVEAGPAYVADNGDVTMDIVDKNGEETGDTVTISGLASDSELSKVEDKADKAQQTANEVAGQIGELKGNVSNQGQQIAGLKDDVSNQGQQIAGLKDDVSNQGQQIAGLKDDVSNQGQQIAGLKDENAAQDVTLNSHEVSIKNHEAVMGVTDKTGLESAYKGATYIDENDTMVEADRKLDAAISDVNSRVDGLSSRVDRLDDRIDKVGAMAAAIANLHTMGYDPAAPTEVAVGVGQYRDETGMALGLFHYPNRDFMLSLSVSTSGDEYMGGIGATWKFGRKSPEKVAEIKKAQAEADARRAEEQKLAKAEEMKKAAKEAKVQAQMERHAKMLAEQEAQA